MDIMDDLQKYVPTLTTNDKYNVSGSDEPVNFTLDDFHYILFGKCCASFIAALRKCKQNILYCIHLYRGRSDDCSSSYIEGASESEATLRGGRINLRVFNL